MRHVAARRSALSSSVYSVATPVTPDHPRRHYLAVPGQQLLSPAAASSDLEEEDVRTSGPEGSTALPATHQTQTRAGAASSQQRSILDRNASARAAGPGRQGLTVSFVEPDMPHANQEAVPPYSSTLSSPTHTESQNPEHQQHSGGQGLHRTQTRASQHVPPRHSPGCPANVHSLHGPRSNMHRRPAQAYFPQVYGFSRQQHAQTRRSMTARSPLGQPPQQSFLGGTPPVHRSPLQCGPPPHRPLYISHFSPSSVGPYPHSAIATFESEDLTRQPNFEDLFFDLLFVANLAVYSGAIDIATMAQVRGFLGYFVLLWW